MTTAPKPTAPQKPDADPWCQKVIGSQPPKRVAAYRGLARRLRIIADAPTTPAGERQRLHLAARSLLGVSAAVQAEIEMARAPCCWEAESGLACRCQVKDVDG